MKSDIDLDQFKKDYYDPGQRVAEVADKYDGLSQFTISAFVHSLGWKNRRESGIIYRPNGLPDKKIVEEFLEHNTLTQTAKHFGISWKAVKRIIYGDGEIIKLKRVGGCNNGCPNWVYCTAIRPETLPCEIHFFDDEFVEMDEDSAIYYHSVGMKDSIKIGS